MDKPKPVIRQIYDDHYRTAGPYNESDPRLEEFGRLVGRCRCRILDLGAGEGFIARYLQSLGHEVIAVDVSEVAVKICRDQGLSAYQCDLENQELPDHLGSFDIVMMTELLDHLLDPLTLLQSKVRRLLRQGGIVIATVSNCVYFKHRWAFLRGHLPVWGEDQRSASQRPYNFQHKTLFTRRGLLETFERAGFIVVHLGPESWAPWQWLRRLGMAQVSGRTIAWVRKVSPNLLAAGFVLKARKR